MSRYNTVSKDQKIVAYGFDLATGYFIQVWPPSANVNDPPTLDLDSFFNGISGPRLAELLDENNVTIPAHHKNAMVMDNPF